MWRFYVLGPCYVFFMFPYHLAEEERVGCFQLFVLWLSVFFVSEFLLWSVIVDSSDILTYF